MGSLLEESEAHEAAARYGAFGTGASCRRALRSTRAAGDDCAGRKPGQEV